MSLSGKVALITGASRGIGLEIARTLAAKGMTVALNGRSEHTKKEAQALREESFDVQAFVADISKKASVDALVEQVEAQLGPLWLLVNNAAVYHIGPTLELTEADWDETFEVNIKGAFLCSQAVLRTMIPRRAGRIVNISSVGGVIVRVEQLAYNASKAALNHLTRCLAIEMAPHGITVNCICPGMTWTDMLAEAVETRNLNRDAMVALIPTGRMADPSDHAHLVAYLASDKTAHLTGQVICVDGGQSQLLPFAADS